ncbi:MAG: RagB/SusD family nutrient uptake outer membrane protein, partial [Bacteroidales bacterium]|nr:RagB/SusD family nutrient uptake outer membrane protein [Bacteroidales bacterium]
MKFRILPIIVLSAMTLPGCEGALQEEVFSQYAPSTLLTTKVGIERVLFSAYGYAAINGNFGGNMQFQEEWTCDQFWETGGAVNQQYVPMANFTFTSEYPTHWTTLWNRFYFGIRDCNIVLENLDNAPIDDDTKKLLSAEARFIRASIYFKASSLWGAVPLKKSQSDPSDMERTPADEIGKFVEEELLAIVNDLPEKGTKGYEYGRATKGAAQAYLMDYYLNTKQWQKCADMADNIIKGGKYKLWNDYTTLFSADNERTNDEYIWVYTCSTLAGPGNEILNGAFPDDYKSMTDGSKVWTSNMRNWARMDRVLNSFYNTFDPQDIRRSCIITEYLNSKGTKV